MSITVRSSHVLYSAFPSCVQQVRGHYIHLFIWTYSPAVSSSTSRWGCLSKRPHEPMWPSEQWVHNIEWNGKGNLNRGDSKLHWKGLQTNRRCFGELVLEFMRPTVNAFASLTLGELDTVISSGHDCCYPLLTKHVLWTFNVQIICVSNQVVE